MNRLTGFEFVRPFFPSLISSNVENFRFHFLTYRGPRGSQRGRGFALRPESTVHGLGTTYAGTARSCMRAQATHAAGSALCRHLRRTCRN